MIALPPRAHETRALVELILADVASAGADEIRVLENGGARQTSQRAELVNRALPSLSSRWVCVLDPFTWLDFGCAALALERSSHVAVQLVGSLARLDRDETARFVTSRVAPEGIAARATPVQLGKASYAVEREVLLALGGLSEAFSGQADEGVELFKRVKAYFRGVTQLEQRGLSLWAKRSEADRAARGDNLALGKRLAQAITDGPDRYLTERLETSLPPKPAALRALVIERGQREAFSVTSHTPPPARPQRLPGSLWGITALFNPAGFRSRLHNFVAFRDRLRAQGLPLLAVELSLGEAKHQLGADDADRVVLARGGDVMWQKERLLNLALRALPPECDKVVWLDADVLFEREDWVHACAAELERFSIVQPFSRSVRLLAGQRRADPSMLPVGAGDGELLHGMAWGVEAKGHGALGRYLEHGHSGYAWAARRELLEKHGLYDRNILGNADLNMAHAMYGGARHLKLERLSPKARAHLSAWAERFYGDVSGSVSSLEGTVFHLWHGERDDRRYIDRLALLQEHDFDPDLDLAEGDSGALVWASHKPALHQAMREYFARRQEDR